MIGFFWTTQIVSFFELFEIQFEIKSSARQSAVTEHDPV